MNSVPFLTGSAPNSVTEKIRLNKSRDRQWWIGFHRINAHGTWRAYGQKAIRRPNMFSSDCSVMPEYLDGAGIWHFRANPILCSLRSVLQFFAMDVFGTDVPDVIACRKTTEPIGNPR
jgi:hypothetical protein